MEKTIIDADNKTFSFEFTELLRYKDLFYTLAKRDYKVRYVQTYLGISWSFIKPILTIGVFTLVFSRGLSIDTQGIPYPIFALCGLAGWSYFSSVMNSSGGSIIAAQNMVQKIYFPRLIIPMAKAVVGLLDFGILFLMLMVFLVIYQYPIGPQFVFFPLFILLSILASLSMGIFLSALSIRYRDFQQIVPFIIQFGMFLTPVAYPSEMVLSKIPNWAGLLYYLNPMAGVIDGLRWSILSANAPSNLSYISFGFVIILFFSSLYYFKKVEKKIADII